MGLSLTLMLVETCTLHHHGHSTVMSHLAIGRAPCLILLSQRGASDRCSPLDQVPEPGQGRAGLDLRALEPDGGLRGVLLS